MFATNDPWIRFVDRHMSAEPGDSAAVERAVAERTEAPTEGETVVLDVRNLGPPKPLRETLERVERLGGGDVLVQYNDRSPQFLFPRLEDRGYAYAAVETDATEATVTAIWPTDREKGLSDDRAGEDDATAT
ncbi:DUF2249 domain-containing protein [Halorubrum sp. Atlit-28R]|nr:DUF2249 domain-containing protein [Halorubrum sp. Atlit-28R]